MLDSLCAHSGGCGAVVRSPATPSSKRPQLLRYLGRLKTNVSHALHRPRAGDAPLYLLSDDVGGGDRAALLGNEDGCAWYSRSARCALLGLLRCARRPAHLQGRLALRPASEPRPFHYYGPKKAACTLAVPKENDEHVHWFEKEHEIYARWQQEGRLASIHNRHGGRWCAALF